MPDDRRLDALCAAYLDALHRGDWLAVFDVWGIATLGREPGLYDALADLQAALAAAGGSGLNSPTR